jgi:hypothetical protein
VPAAWHYPEDGPRLPPVVKGEAESGQEADPSVPKFNKKSAWQPVEKSRPYHKSTNFADILSENPR